MAVSYNVCRHWVQSVAVTVLKSSTVHDGLFVCTSKPCTVRVANTPWIAVMARGREKFWRLKLSSMLRLRRCLLSRTTKVRTGSGFCCVHKTFKVYRFAMTERNSNPINTYFHERVRISALLNMKLQLQHPFLCDISNRSEQRAPWMGIRPHRSVHVLRFCGKWSCLFNHQFRNSFIGLDRSR